MNMKKTILTASVILLVCTHNAWAQKVYKCVSGGQVTYSGSPGKGCTLMKDSSISVISGSPTTESAPSSPSEIPMQQNPEGNSAAIAQAEAEYQNALKALEEGKAVRYGNEKNYVRYQERIQQLQNAVDAAQQKLNQLKTGG